jgi:hypothetical protein
VIAFIEFISANDDSNMAVTDLCGMIFRMPQRTLERDYHQTKKKFMRKLTNKLGQISDIDLRLLKVFCSVVENGGVSPAEVSLGISRSTIGTHLKVLESRLAT